LTTALIGLGNILLRDEGIGVHAVRAIKDRYTFCPGVDVIDGGTLGLDLLPFFEDRDKILILDAVNFRKEPGYIGIIEDEDIPAVLSAKLSVHHIGLTDVLFAAKLLGIEPSGICLIGIQPQSLNTGLEMTELIGNKMEELITLSINKLKEWKIECALQSHQRLSA